MAARNKPYEQFGPYILFRRLESDALGDLWRAGRIEGGAVGSPLALRRLTGGDRQALAASAEFAGHVVPQLTGATFARGQVAGVIDGVPYLAWDFAGGRSLRMILQRSRGGRDTPPAPLAIDHAVAIAERVALSLATMADLRDGSGTRLCHGALLPHFVWIHDDGEIRVAGQQLGSGIVSSLADSRLGAEIGAYFSPEYRTGAPASKSADVYSLGALLFLLVTGNEPPDSSNASAFGSAVRAAKSTGGVAVPDDIRVILDKSFNLDPSMRYASVGDMKQALSALAHGGRYTATTFNLAFYLSTLLKKDLEIEAAEREKEAKLSLAPYLEAPSSPDAPAAEPVHAAPTFATSIEQPRKSRLPWIAAAVVLAAVAAGGVWLVRGRKPAPATAPVAAASTVPSAPAQPRVISEPVVASASPAEGDETTTAGTTASEQEAQKRAFEAAVRAKLQAEMMKLQTDFMAELRQSDPRNAPTPAAAPSAPAEERTTLTAAQLDQQRREAAVRQEPVPVQTTAAPPPAQQAATAPVQPATTTAAPVPQPAQQSAVREGDMVDVASLDELPRALRPIAPAYPPMAKQQRVSATIILTALIDESGNVTEVRVLRGEPRFGLNDAAIRAMRSSRFSSPMKDGKRVRTWFPQTIEFRP